MVDEKFSIDLAKNGVQKTIYAKQGDTGLRKMSITLTSNGKVVSLAGYSLKALYDNDTYVSLENEGNPIEILLDGVICQAVGEHYCEILVYSEDNTLKLYSSQFRIIVEATIGGEDEAEAAQNPDHYVLAETGKTLTSNDFTDALKDKLDGIEAGAEANVQADWNEADSTADDFIKNKPVIPDITGKQDTLVSGENIKTVNGQSILGRGNMQVSAESIDWSNVQNKPDTLNGYGITDAYSKNETDILLDGKADVEDWDVEYRITFDGDETNGYAKYNKEKWLNFSEFLDAVSLYYPGTKEHHDPIVKGNFYLFGYVSGLQLIPESITSFDYIGIMTIYFNAVNDELGLENKFKCELTEDYEKLDGTLTIYVEELST